MSLPAEFTFDEAAHVYRVGGVRWPSVTEILQPLQIMDGIPRHVLDAAAAFGRNVHRACHLHNVGALDESTLDAALVPYLNGWKQFCSDMEVRVIASEQQVTHQRLRYAGTLDVRAVVRRKYVDLIDIKATAVIPRTVGPQTAAYAAALDEARIGRRVVQLKSDGTYRTRVLNDRADWNVFLSAFNIFTWRNANAD